MKNVRRIISSKVGHLDSIYAGKKYDEIVYHKTLDQLVYSLKINFNDGKR